MQRLEGMRVLVFVEDTYEDLELWYPKLRLAEEGAEVVSGFYVPMENILGSIKGGEYFEIK